MVPPFAISCHLIITSSAYISSLYAPSFILYFQPTNSYPVFSEVSFGNSSVKLSSVSLSFWIVALTFSPSCLTYSTITLGKTHCAVNVIVLIFVSVLTISSHKNVSSCLAGYTLPSKLDTQPSNT